MNAVHKLRTHKVTRKQNTKSTGEKCAVAFGLRCEWTRNGVTTTGTLAEWHEIAGDCDWYTLDLHKHQQALDAFLAPISIVRHFEAGHTCIAINTYSCPAEELTKAKPSYRIINASYLLAGKSIEEWHAITGANAATITAQLLQVIDSLDETIKSSFGCHLAMTIPSTALEAWKRCIPKGESYSRQHRDVEALSRAAFFGGWNYCDASKTHENGVYFDANSLYAYIMRSKGVPEGRAIATRSYRTGDIGIYSVRVSHLYDGALNPVSCRVGYDVVHPTCQDENDSFVTEMTSVDIELCRRLDIKIDVISGYKWQKMIYPFVEFVDKCESLRNSSARGTAINATARLLQASLFGKFGAQSTNKEIMITDTDLSSSGYQLADGIVSLSGNDRSEYKRWTRDVESTSGTIQPHWAAFITAHARAYLFDALLVAGKENLLYAATDSLVLTSEGASRLLSSDYCKDLSQYGQFKIVHRFLRFKAFAHNRYAGDAANDDGEYYLFGASSGIPNAPDLDHNALYAAWLAADVVSDDQALRVVQQRFSTSQDAVKRALELRALQARIKAKRSTQTRTEMFGVTQTRKVDKW